MYIQTKEPAPNEPWEETPKAYVATHGRAKGLTTEQIAILDRDGFEVVKVEGNEVTVIRKQKLPSLEKETMRRALQAMACEMGYGPICRRKYEDKPAAWREKQDLKRKARVQA